MGDTRRSKAVVVAGLGAVLLTGGAVAPVSVLADDLAPASAGEQVAPVEVGDKSALAAAVSGAQDGIATEVKLTVSIELDDALVIPSGKILVLNLNGHNLSCVFGKNVIDNNGALTVKNGTVAVKENGPTTKMSCG